MAAKLTADKATEKTEKEPGSKKLPIPLIIGIVALLLVVIVGKGFFGGRAGAKEHKKISTEVGITVPMEEFLVNLDGGGDHYLRASISLGMRKGITEEEVKEQTALTRDAVLSILSTKTLGELNKPKNKEDLKDELKRKINDVAGDDAVVKVYFTAFATQ